MRFLEELQMNALPALQTILFDGWVLRFADGYTNRANSINPIYKSEKDVSYKIEMCEKLFQDRGLKPVYKITPYIFPETLDNLLEDRGYNIINKTSVQMLSLLDYKGTMEYAVTIKNSFNEKWFEYYCSSNGINDKNSSIYRMMLSNLTLETIYVSLCIEDKIIACGMAVFESDYLGIFDISVSEEYRNQGYGNQLIKDMLSIGKEYGAKNVYLQVMTNNKPALKLYNKFGFKEKYQYYYRVLN